MDNSNNSVTLKEYRESGITILADGTSTTSRKTPFYYNKDYKVIRSLVTSILTQYIDSKDAISCPVKCIDVIGSAGTCGLLWKEHLGDKVDVIINDVLPETCQLINKNALKNNLSIQISNKDPCIVLHERGYNFIYLDCTNEASHYFDAAFRNISRNGVIVITAKDDCSLHGNTPDVAMRRYAGRITRTFYYHELGIRLFIAALARTAVKYNKSISVLCCFAHKSTFTVAVRSSKGLGVANQSIENIRPIKHCMVCEEREFYPPSFGFPIDINSITLDCNCASTAPGKTDLELGPVWAGAIFNVNYIEGILSQKKVTSYLELLTVLTMILQEAKCPRKDLSSEASSKKLKLEDAEHPPFYYNIHKHHPQVAQLMKINKVIEGLHEAGFRASKTHFDKLAIRTDATLQKLLEVMKHIHEIACK